LVGIKPAQYHSHASPCCLSPKLLSEALSTGTRLPVEIQANPENNPNRKYNLDAKTSSTERNLTVKQLVISRVHSTVAFTRSTIIISWPI